jgi:hypothetical protein
MDPRLLKECKNKLIIIKSIEEKSEQSDMQIYREFIETVDNYANLTSEYNRALILAERIRISLKHYEPKVKDIKERTRGALMLHFGKKSNEYLSYMRSSEYAKLLAKERRDEKKLKKDTEGQNPQ